MLKFHYLSVVVLVVGMSGCVSVSVDRKNKKSAAPYSSGETVAQPLMTTPLSAPEKTLVEHQIVAGDSLWKIARQYETTVAEIKAANQMEGDTILAGQKLMVPTTMVPEGGVTHDATGIFESGSAPTTPAPPVIIPPITSS